jgi:hypothetical protein
VPHESSVRAHRSSITQTLAFDPRRAALHFRPPVLQRAESGTRPFGAAARVEARGSETCGMLRLAAAAAASSVVRSLPQPTRVSVRIDRGGARKIMAWMRRACPGPPACQLRQVVGIYERLWRVSPSIGSERDVVASSRKLAPTRGAAAEVAALLGFGTTLVAGRHTREVPGRHTREVLMFRSRRLHGTIAELVRSLRGLPTSAVS